MNALAREAIEAEGWHVLGVDATVQDDGPGVLITLKRRGQVRVARGRTEELAWHRAIELAGADEWVTPND